MGKDIRREVQQILESGAVHMHDKMNRVVSVEESELSLSVTFIRLAEETFDLDHRETCTQVWGGTPYCGRALRVG